MSNRQKALNFILEASGPVSMAELKKLSISKSTIQSLIKSGDIESPAWGVYKKPGVEESVYAEWALVAFRYPSAVVCLLSAASFHNMTQELPGSLTVGVSRKMGGTPSMGGQFTLAIDTLIWRNDDMLDLSVDKHRIDGVDVKITSPERTLVDLFRYSTFNPSMRDTAVRITDEMFLECLNRCSSDEMGHFSFDTVAAIAREFGCYEEMRPYTKTIRYARAEIPSY